MLQRQDHFDYTEHASCRLRVSDIRLQRPQHHRGDTINTAGKDLSEGTGLDGVTQACASAVSIDSIDVFCTDSGVSKGSPNNPRLRRAMRDGETCAGTILVDRSATDHCEDPITVGLRIRQWLQQ